MSSDILGRLKQYSPITWTPSRYHDMIMVAIYPRRHRTQVDVVIGHLKFLTPYFQLEGMADLENGMTGLGSTLPSSFWTCAIYSKKWNEKCFPCPRSYKSKILIDQRKSSEMFNSPSLDFKIHLRLILITFQ